MSVNHQRIASDGYVVPPASDLRRRAAVACQNCRDRKVKCNVTESGIPCVNCRRDGIHCDVKRRKKNTARRSRRQPSQNTGEVSTSDPPGSTTPGNDSRSIHGYAAPLFGTTAIDAILNDKTWSGAVPFFVGDPQGVGYVLDICNFGSSASAKHYLIPQSLPPLLDSDDMDYLRAKGVFSLPPPEVCDELFRCYFTHIHPVMPIVEADHILNAYVESGVQKLNLLLTWSMFSVASNYIRDEDCHRAGFKSKADMKRVAFLRAKCMYDNGHEQDKIAIVQSTLLMSFWYSNTEDRTESWHWIGIAISLAQTMGFHRDPDLSGRNHRLSDRQRQLWRRLWWSCVYRDRWQSLGLGRPMRIAIEDCDIPSPSVEDALNDFQRVSNAALRFIPEPLKDLSRYWIILLEITAVLGDILAGLYRPKMPLLDSVAVENLETKLITSMASVPVNDRSAESPPMAFHESHLQLHYSTAIITLYRPYETEDGTFNHVTGPRIWRNHAKQKIREAASNTNKTLDKIFVLGLTNHIGPMAIALIVSAMATHLLDLRSPEHLVQQIASNKLAFCMTVMDELKSLYPAAMFYHDLFTKAKMKIDKQQSLAAKGAQQVPTSSTIVGQISTDTAAFQSTSTTFAGEMPLLFNDSTLFDFWDPNSLFPYSFSSAPSLDMNVNQAIGYNEFEDMFSNMWQNGQL